MRKAAIITIAVALSSCTTIDTSLSENLPAACERLETYYAAFNVLAATGKIGPDVVRKANAAYGGVSVFCEDPSRVTTKNAPVLVAAAYATVVVLLADARKDTGA